MDRSTTPAGRASGVPRRTAIAGTGVLAVTGAALAACGDGGGGGGGGEAPAKGTVIGKASDVQVGGGTVFKDAETVVTQPAEGEFKAFSAICTHQGCLVDSVSDGLINCKCHGSQFTLDGRVAKGPARDPLPAREVTVTEAGDIVAG
ncbi:MULTISPECIES: Rieske (2Fe-2S) protein [Thermocrispum]|jgi:nitrite reductase/ring-hydroxylating ferredoxin subunit|uniref:Cytochrome bc1 complex Rieske iron-sulfur subunit n=1 Tax=Thermocrispum agreste TaxID=37925 RepID=A0A2W4JES1_9PSEU|nr:MULTISPECIES: Rieske (2Fe-2S) protein [Thermocrispum]PZM97570.1 MAG: Rieske (2Fe-2S) protein [Thermocrispum agreste]